MMTASTRSGSGDGTKLSPAFRDAMRPEWRRGAYGVILDGGSIRAGDGVELEEVEAEIRRPGQTLGFRQSRVVRRNLAFLETRS